MRRGRCSSCRPGRRARLARSRPDRVACAHRRRGIPACRGGRPRPSAPAAADRDRRRDDLPRRRRGRRDRDRGGHRRRSCLPTRADRRGVLGRGSAETDRVPVRGDRRPVRLDRQAARRTAAVAARRRVVRRRRRQAAPARGDVCGDDDPPRPVGEHAAHDDRVLRRGRRWCRRHHRVAVRHWRSGCPTTSRDASRATRTPCCTTSRVSAGSSMPPAGRGSSSRSPPNSRKGVGRIHRDRARRWSARRPRRRDDLCIDRGDRERRAPTTSRTAGRRSSASREFAFPGRARARPRAAPAGTVGRPARSGALGCRVRAAARSSRGPRPAAGGLPRGARPVRATQRSAVVRARTSSTPADSSSSSGTVDEFAADGSPIVCVCSSTPSTSEAADAIEKLRSGGREFVWLAGRYVDAGADGQLLRRLRRARRAAHHRGGRAT